MTPANAMEETKTAIRFTVNTRASRFTVRAFASGVLSAFGHNPNIAIREFTGEAQVNPEKVEESRLLLTINAASLGVTDDISDKDRREIERQMLEEVLEVSSYPEIVYECSRFTANKTGEGQYQVTLDGDLTLHGVTRNQSVSARVTLGGDTLTAFGDFALRQSDYEIELVSALGGALKVKDEIKGTFNIVARKQG
jgi:polyisoprenoid-binding protein YceI